VVLSDIHVHTLKSSLRRKALGTSQRRRRHGLRSRLLMSGGRTQARTSQAAASRKQSRERACYDQVSGHSAQPSLLHS
jgi:hypothetical protein